MAQQTGAVAWFDSASGYGFIGHENGPDVFCDFARNAYSSPSKGDVVLFDVHESPEGNQAMNVKRVE